MLDDENDFIIVSSTIDMAHGLGLEVIAEGVEQQETQLRLRKQKCDYAQGFHIAQPMSEKNFLNWLESSDSVAVPAEPAIPIPIDEPTSPPNSATAAPIIAKDADSNNMISSCFRLYYSITDTTDRFLSLNGLYSVPPPS